MRKAFVASTMSVLMALLASIAMGQTTSGIITGRVIDPQGHSIPGAEVVLTQDLTGVKLNTTTDASGDFVFPSVLPARYSLTVNAPGFKRFERLGFTLTSFERLSVGTVKLEVGSLTESITVTAEAAPVIQTASPERSAVLNDKQMTTTSAGRSTGARSSTRTKTSCFSSSPRRFNPTSSPASEPIPSPPNWNAGGISRTRGSRTTR